MKPIKLVILSGGGQRHYLKGFVYSLLDQNIEVEFIGNDEMESDPFFLNPKIKYYNYRGSQVSQVSLLIKIKRIIIYYFRIVIFTSRTDASIFHIQWHNKFIFFDKLILILFYKYILKKKVIVTVHDISEKFIIRADWNESKKIKISHYENKLNMLMYRVVDKIVVHNKYMKEYLTLAYKLAGEKISIVNHGLNIDFYNKIIDVSRAKSMLNIGEDRLVILFFGNIASNKGLDLLLRAFKELYITNHRYYLIVAGNFRQSHEQYKRIIENEVKDSNIRENAILMFRNISDEEIPLIFSASDVVIQPYRNIYQSGVLFLAYTFRKNVLASKVGAFEEIIREDQSGDLFEPNSVTAIIETVEKYFREVNNKREYVFDKIFEKYDWKRIGSMYYSLYRNAIEEKVE